MHILAITSDPQDSLAAGLAERYLSGALDAGAASIDRIDLAREAFPVGMTSQDLAHYRGQGPLPAEVREQQLRIERADVLLLAFPIYWWSMPARMKGWIDRVFTRGWAFDRADSAPFALAGKRVRLIATGGAGERLYDRHGYRQAMATQIEHGIFHFVGVEDVRTHFFFAAEQAVAADRQRHLATAHWLGQALAAPGVDAGIGAVA